VATVATTDTERERAPLAAAPETDITVTIHVPGIMGGKEQLSYLELLGALALAEQGGCPAQPALECHALPRGWDVGMAIDGSHVQRHPRFHFTPRRLETVVWAARQLARMAPPAGEDADEDAGESAAPGPVPPAQRRAEMAFDPALLAHSELLDGVRERIGEDAYMRLEAAAGEVHARTLAAIEARLLRLAPQLAPLVHLVTGTIDSREWEGAAPDEEGA
jgi:hypothetical protein